MELKAGFRRGLQHVCKSYFSTTSFLQLILASTCEHFDWGVHYGYFWHASDIPNIIRYFCIIYELKMEIRCLQLSGVETQFDVHRQTVTHPSVSVTNLLPGTEYQVRVRAADRSRNLGPWNEHPIVARTQGQGSAEMTDNLLRFLRHYERNQGL